MLLVSQRQLTVLLLFGYGLTDVSMEAPIAVTSSWRKYSLFHFLCSKLVFPDHSHLLWQDWRLSLSTLTILVKLKFQVSIDEVNSFIKSYLCLTHLLLIFSYLCAIPAACCWGCNLACLAFEHIWCLTPSIKYCKINLYPLMRLYSFAIQCLCVPFFEAVALVFSKVGIHKVEQPPEYKSRHDEFEVMMTQI